MSINTELRKLLNILCLLLPMSLILADVSCKKKYLEASIFQKQFEFLNYTSNQSCNWNIIPSTKFFNVKDYYLELKWTYFDVKGLMPNCSDAYVDAYMTKQERFMGRFCSQEKIEMIPFDIFSLDGRAKISFRSGIGSSGGGLIFSYVMKSKLGDYLGTSTNCSHFRMNSSMTSALLYSPGWPVQYNHKKCNYHITTKELKWTKIIFFDVDFKFDTVSWPGIKEFISIKGWNSIYFKEDLLTQSYTKYEDFVTITTEYDNIHIKLEGVHTKVLQRGLLAGVIKYGEKDKPISERGNAVSIVFTTILILLSISSIVSFIIVKGLCKSDFMSRSYRPLLSFLQIRG